jgi:hypothetical protein
MGNTPVCRIGANASLPKPAFHVLFHRVSPRLIFSC